MPEHTVYAVASGKGGVGKTVTTVNLGAALAAQGFTVVLVDADLGMANLGGYLGVGEEGRTLHEVLAGEADLESAVYEVGDGLAVVPSGISLNGFANVETAALSDAVDALEDAFDYVLMDIGAGLSHDNVLPLALADAVVLVSTPKPLALQDTAKTREITERLGGAVAGAVLARAGQPGDLDLESVGDQLGIPVLAVIPEDDAVQRSVDEGRPVVGYDADSPAAEGFRGLADIVVEESLSDAPVVPDFSPATSPAGDAAGADESTADGAAGAGESTADGAARGEPPADAAVGDQPQPGGAPGEEPPTEASGGQPTAESASGTEPGTRPAEEGPASESAESTTAEASEDSDSAVSTGEPPAEEPTASGGESATPGGEPAAHSGESVTNEPAPGDPADSGAVEGGQPGGADDRAAGDSREHSGTAAGSGEDGREFAPEPDTDTTAQEIAAAIEEATEEEGEMTAEDLGLETEADIHPESGGETGLRIESDGDSGASSAADEPAESDGRTVAADEAEHSEGLSIEGTDDEDDEDEESGGFLGRLFGG